MAEPTPATPEAERDSASGAAARSLRSFLPRTPGSWLVLALAVLIAAGGLIFAWTQLPHDPGEHSPEAGFLRDMQTHHSQAVQMAMAIRDRTSDEQLKALTTDMAFAQAGEIGMMQGYLDAWNLPATGTDAPMAWMGHPLADGESMPGMASDEGLAKLSSLPVDQAEILFLQLMIRHHQGGVEMAQALLDRSDNALVRDLAQRIIRTQNNEINTMNIFLQERGAQPITDPLPASPDHSGM
ncbi:MAG: DUF305 domain-containing protein [Thermomicrobiales bacterium]